jgi:hypothetical protein
VEERGRQTEQGMGAGTGRKRNKDRNDGQVQIKKKANANDVLFELPQVGHKMHNVHVILLPSHNDLVSLLQRPRAHLIRSDFTGVNATASGHVCADTTLRGSC